VTSWQCDQLFAVLAGLPVLCQRLQRYRLTTDTHCCDRPPDAFLIPLSVLSCVCRPCVDAVHCHTVASAFKNVKRNSLLACLMCSWILRSQENCFPGLRKKFECQGSWYSMHPYIMPHPFKFGIGYNATAVIATICLFTAQCYDSAVLALIVCPSPWTWPLWISANNW